MFILRKCADAKLCRVNKTNKEFTKVSISLKQATAAQLCELEWEHAYL